MIKNFDGKKLKDARYAKSLSQDDLAKKLNVSRQTVIHWESGRFAPGGNLLEDLARILEKPIDYFMKKTAIQVREDMTFYGGGDPNTVRIPVLANVPAGYPEFYEADIDAYIELPRYMAKGVSFAIRCCGDSMEPMIAKGDECLIRITTEPLNNKIMLVQTPQGYAIKRIVKKDGIIELHSDNHKYETFKVSEVKVLGQVVKVLKNVE